MAEESCRKRLLDEGTCPICRDYFTDPVTLDCGHNFCSTCIERAIMFLSRNIRCPLCRETVEKKKLRPNSQLANMVEIVRDLSNLLKLRGVCSVEEADQKFAKDQINHALEILKKERENFLEYRTSKEMERQYLIEQMEAEKQKTATVFRQLHEFLEEQEDDLLAKTAEVQKEIARRSDRYLGILSGELFSLYNLIHEVEEMQKQSGSELLQNSGDILERCKKKSFEKSAAYPITLVWTILDRCDITLYLVGTMNQFKESLVSGLQIKEANVSLDPDTAHPSLILSEDCKSVRWKEEQQDLPNNLERFEDFPYVLGCEGFTAGRHFWDVVVGSEEEWSVGVARKSVNRKGEDGGGIWEMGKWDGEYRVPFLSNNFYLNQGEDIKKIRVTVNYAGRQVGFFDADTGAVLFLYSDVPFGGETLLPCFNVSRRGHLTLCS